MNSQVPTPKSSRLGLLGEVWRQRDNSTLGEWVSEVSSAFFENGLDLIPAAELIEAQPAELYAALSLATLSDENLVLVSKYNPPITTWFFLAECPPDDLAEVLETVDKRPNGVSASEATSEAVRQRLGPSIADSIAELDSRAFAYLAEKALQHGALSEKGRRALKSFGAWLRTGKPLTLKQVSYAHSLIQELVNKGVVAANSPDGDEEIMLAALKAVGRL
jgi:hypothetical protein